MFIQEFCKAAVAVCLLALPLVASDSPFVGNWKFNPAKSKFSAGAPSLKSATVRVEAEGNGLKSTVEGVDADGNPIKYVAQSSLDGTPGTITGSPNMDTTELKKVDDHTLSAVVKKAGKVVYTDKRVVSKDGKSLTVTRTGTSPAGQKYTATLVMDRQ